MAVNWHKFAPLSLLRPLTRAPARTHHISSSSQSKLFQMNELGWIIRASFGNRYFCHGTTVTNWFCHQVGKCHSVPPLGLESHLVLHYSPRTLATAGLFWKIHSDTLKSSTGGRGRAWNRGGGWGLTALRPLNPPHCEYDPLSDFPIRSPAPASQQVIKFFQFTYFSNCC